MSLGLALAGIYFVAKLETGGDGSSWSTAYLGSLLFCSAVAFKQIGLYLALPFFFYLLGAVLREGSKKGISHGALRLGSLGLVVIGTFVVFASPWLLTVDPTTTAISRVQQILHRVFPFARGLFGEATLHAFLASCFHLPKFTCFQRTK